MCITVGRNEMNYLYVILSLLLVLTLKAEAILELEEEICPFPDCFMTNSVDFGFPEKPNDVYIYPLPEERPDYKEIRDTFMELWQVPEDILENISDEGLIVTMVNNPFLMWKITKEEARKQSLQSVIVKHSDFEFFMLNSNCVKEFYKRDSAFKLAFQTIMNPEYRYPPTDDIEFKKYGKKLGLLYTLVVLSDQLDILEEKELLQLFDHSLIFFLNRDNTHNFSYGKRSHYYHPREMENNQVILSYPFIFEKIMYILKYKPYMRILEEKGLPTQGEYKGNMRGCVSGTKEDILIEQFIKDYNLSK